MLYWQSSQNSFLLISMFTRVPSNLFILTFETFSSNIYWWFFLLGNLCWRFFQIYTNLMSLSLMSFFLLLFLNYSLILSTVTLCKLGLGLAYNKTGFIPVFLTHSNLVVSNMKLASSFCFIFFSLSLYIL